MKILKAEFFKTDAGNEPVRDWILGLDADDRRIVGKDIGTIEFGWPVGMPVCHSVRGGRLREVRSTIQKGKVEARVYFAVEGDAMLLLNSETGKTGQDKAIDLAIDRHKSYKAGKRK